MQVYKLNPFRPTRWEQNLEGRNLIWYSSTSNELIGSKSAFVYGSRGSGKTTLLRGICWEDLTANEPLRLQKKITDFDHIGIYVRFPDHMGASFSERVWSAFFGAQGDPEHEFHRAFSLAVEAACLEKVMNAAHELRKVGELTYSATDELDLISDLVAEFPNLKNFSGELKTFADARRCFRSLARETTQLFGRGDIVSLWQRLPPRDPSEMLSFVCERLSNVSRFSNSPAKAAPRFKFCLDDCEVLDSFQRKSLNSLVRQSRHPVSWVIASVGKSQWAGDTYLKSQPLTDADRVIVSLDRREKAEFGDLCQAVTSMRLLFSLPSSVRPALGRDEVKSFFDFDQRLGVQSVNSLMQKMLKRSSRIAIDVQRGEQALQETRGSQSDKAGSVELPPYYEAYTLMHWQGAEDRFTTSYAKDFEDRLKGIAPKLNEGNFNAWLRRKQVAALLQFSSKASLKRLPLSGWKCIVSLADGSIRDFLEIIAEIYDNHVSNVLNSTADEQVIVKFCESRTKIADEVQTRGIYQASERYFEGISNRHDLEGDLLTRIISGLCYLTSFLQASPSDPRVLAVAERGVFMFIPEKTGKVEDSRHDDVIAALRQAELAGYLRPVSDARMPSGSSRRVDGSILVYRLHKRFSPHFRFSYRGAYEPFKITFDEIYELFLNSERGGARIWAQRMSGLSERDGVEQYLLPFGEDV